MEKELLNSDKEILLKDLCCRLPYGVKCKISSEEGAFKLKNFLHGTSFYAFDFYIKDNMSLSFKHIEEIKPYLFPLSSITDEQKEEHQDLISYNYNFDANGNVFTLQDFYCKYHFDYRGLIPMGLAVDCTNLDIY